MEWSTSTDAGELNPRTYTRDGTDIKITNRGEASNILKTLKRAKIT